jgi:hypothetical protein
MWALCLLTDHVNAYTWCESSCSFDRSITFEWASTDENDETIGDWLAALPGPRQQVAFTFLNKACQWCFLPDLTPPPQIGLMSRRSQWKPPTGATLWCAASATT